uniref:Small ribosomal subunit protein uS15m n=1 Tax=Alona affinis TaxID=381656 RepID=A0A9N6WS53_9CRUS|nr:EOG090X09BQ [Alona affinis]
MLKLVKFVAIASTRQSAAARIIPFAALQHRPYKTEMNLEWVEPPKIPCIDPAKSGDRSPLPQVDLKSLRPKFAKSGIKVQMFMDRKDISEEVKRLSTIEFAPHKEHVKVIKQEALSKVQRHVMDCGTMEAQITCLTIKIRNMQRHMAMRKHDKSAKVLLKEMIEQRNSYLGHLRRFDYKRFEWLLEKMDLVYYAPVNMIERVTRKGALRKLTAYYCDKVRKDRLEEYRLELEKEKEVFSKEKEEVLKWIEQEEQELLKLKSQG